MGSKRSGQAHRAYVQLVEGLNERFKDESDKTLRRKLARQAARSVLPNATETKIFVTANARALRHFIEMRGNRHAEVEIRKLAVQVLPVDAARSAAPFRRLRTATPSRRDVRGGHRPPQGLNDCA